MFFDEKYTAHAGADFGMNLTETDPTEQEARRVPLEMFYKGMGLVGLKTRYAVNAAGRRHLKDLVQRKKASNSSLMAELHIAKMRNDLGYFKTSPAVPTHFTGMDFKDGPSVWKAKVLKSSGMKTLPGAGGMSKGFLVKFSSGHVGMVQRRIGSKSSHTRTAKGYKRWTNAKGNVEKLVTMGSPSATAMHHTIWPEVEPSVEEYLQERLQAQVERVLARAGKK